MIQIGNATHALHACVVNSAFFSDDENSIKDEFLNDFNFFFVLKKFISNTKQAFYGIKSFYDTKNMAISQTIVEDSL